MDNDFTALFAHPDYLQAFKQRLKQKDMQLQQQFNPFSSVSDLLKERSDCIDHLLATAWQHFLAGLAGQLCLVAVGGYGRRELFPYSDIDILVVLDAKSADACSGPLADFFTFLWDIGLKPGQSVRTLDECISLAVADQTIMTSLMEIRLLAGSAALFEQLKDSTSPDRIWSSDHFFTAKMEEQRQRYAKFHDTAYNLEPNVKEGPGGLRDMQVVAWVFKRHYNATTLKELIKYGFMPESEYLELVAARDVLWRIRYALHLLTGRGEDRLLFDYQRELAQQFGFGAGTQSSNQDVEQFMQFYFKTVQGLERLNEMLLQLFNERFVCGESGCKPTDINDHFIAINRYIEAVDEQVFEREPLLLLEIFLLLQQDPGLDGIRATTIRLIRKNLYLINDDFRNNKTANRYFIEIFRQSNGITHLLRRMNRYGVLAAYLPAFANIVARMQYDLFHIYTVDEHTLFVVRNLRRLSLQGHSHELPFCSTIFQLVPKPEVLYLAALFHDIAKGMGGDHSTVGQEIAIAFCEQHGLSRQDTKLVAWLVRNHLIMSMTAQRKDISDADVVHSFACQVGSINYLNHLYLLTVADIRATSPQLWNSWKDYLLRELYTATHSTLHKGLQNPVAIADRLRENKKEAMDELLRLGMLPAAIETTWQCAPDDYFMRYSADEIAWHSQAISLCSPQDLPLVLFRPETRRGSAEVFVYGKNEGAIFSLSTATLDQLGLSILDARIMTTLNNYVLNSFQILEQSGKPINDSCRQQHICMALRNNLSKQAVNGQGNIHRQSRQAKHFPIPTSIAFHSAPSGRQTVMELITTDRIGLLSKIGQAFIQQGISLHSAKITTIGSRVEDMFYIADQHGQPIDDLGWQVRIREEILKILASDSETLV